MKLDRTVAPKICQIDHFSIEKPQLHVMRNGMPLNIIQAGSEDVVRFDLLIQGGQWNQEQPLQAMFTNRMLREGTSSMSSAEIAEKLDYYGAWLDLSSSVNYGFVTLYSLVKYFPQTLEILASMVKEPVFPEKELQVVTEINKQQYLVNSERVEVLARKQLNRSLFGNSHPLGRYAELEDYDRITPEILKRFYQTCYHSANCSAYVSGKVTPEVVRCIEQQFGDAAWGDVSQRVHHGEFAAAPDDRKRVFIEKEEALQGSVKMGGFSLNRMHPDYLKLRVLITLFGGYFGSRLMSNIREEKGYTYGISAGVVCYPDTGVLVISSEAANEYVEPLIAEVYKEIDILRTERVDEKELDMVRNYMLGDMCRSYESAFSLSDAWIFIETSGLDNQFFDRSVKAIREVTADEIRQLAEKYLCKENLIEVVAGKKV
ncbi:pitrilysin family protein [Phocaeicola sp. KGMB11183]|jgi:predicted Zn-dependent peptidase|uniref:Pitrilysin family protein n=1 Tax=Phocaeicola acetigenes TaxID=3016083 RepID=A0ABT4PEU2_9BACT|nr:pitrilysin family protein [Phocaeicola sp. KGMB11183]MCZ8371543.1 pitrilysin family protein [Phocaeicola sp. KGMB11183]